MGEEKKINRRDYLKYTGAAIGGLVVGGALGYVLKPSEVIKETVTAPAATVTLPATTIEKTVTHTITTTITGSPITTPTVRPVTLDFWRWSYASDFVARCLKRFEDHYGIKVNHLEAPSAEYYAKLLSLFVAKTPIEVVTVRDEYLEEWMSAGWIKPLDEIGVISKSEIEDYRNRLAGPSRERAFYKGRFWGLPYYTGTYVWYGNKNLIKKAGFDEFPKTYDELYEQCKALYKEGVKYPISIWPGHAMEIGVKIMRDVLAAGIYPVFDENFEPLWRDNDKLIKIWEFYQEAWKNKWINPADWTEETSYMIGEFAAERNCFGWHSYYQLNAFNDPKRGGKAAGHVNIFNTITYDKKDYPARALGYARIYSITPWCEYPYESWLLIQFLGGKDWEGKFWMAKQWFLNYGLGFGYPELWNDSEIIASAKAWLLPDPSFIAEIEKTAIAHPHSIVKWATEWFEAARPLYQEMVMGTRTPKETQAQIADKWVELRKKYTGK